jgi:hypothetical protein
VHGRQLPFVCAVVARLVGLGQPACAQGVGVGVGGEGLRAAQARPGAAAAAAAGCRGRSHRCSHVCRGRMLPLRKVRRAAAPAAAGPARPGPAAAPPPTYALALPLQRPRPAPPVFRRDHLRDRHHVVGGAAADGAHQQVAGGVHDALPGRTAAAAVGGGGQAGRQAGGPYSRGRARQAAARQLAGARAAPGSRRGPTGRRSPWGGGRGEGLPASCPPAARQLPASCPPAARQLPACPCAPPAALVAHVHPAGLLAAEDRGADAVEEVLAAPQVGWPRRGPRAKAPAAPPGRQLLHDLRRVAARASWVVAPRHAAASGVGDGPRRRSLQRGARSSVPGQGPGPPTPTSPPPPPPPPATPRRPLKPHPALHMGDVVDVAAAERLLAPRQVHLRVGGRD